MVMGNVVFLEIDLEVFIFSVRLDLLNYIEILGKDKLYELAIVGVNYFSEFKEF